MRVRPRNSVVLYFDQSISDLFWENMILGESLVTFPGSLGHELETEEEEVMNKCVLKLVFNSLPELQYSFERSGQVGW